MEIAEQLIGKSVRLIKMNGEDEMPSGLFGVITSVDDIGQIHVRWENGSTLALIPEVDEFEFITKTQHYETI